MIKNFVILFLCLVILGFLIDLVNDETGKKIQRERERFSECYGDGEKYARFTRVKTVHGGLHGYLDSRPRVYKGRCILSVKFPDQKYAVGIPVEDVIVLED